jgi:hypothetical protein
MDTTNNTADVLDDAKQLLSNYMAGKSIGGTIDRNRQTTIVLASMILAVATEMRRLTNTLAEMADGQELAESVRIWGGE